MLTDFSRAVISNYGTLTITTLWGAEGRKGARTGEYVWWETLGKLKSGLDSGLDQD